MGEKIYKTGIIGCGNVFDMHAIPIVNNKYAELMAVCDIKNERAEKKAKKYNCKHYTDYKKMIQSEDLDVIHVLTPHYLHPSMVIYGAEEGLNVLTEKPMSINLEDAEKMVKVAKENNVTLGVIFQSRYNSGPILVKEMLTANRLGKILGGKLSVTWKRTDDYYSKSDWKGTWEKEGGGVVIDQSIHTLDLMRWLLNDDIEYVEASIGNRAHEIIQVEDSAEGVIKFKNGTFIGFYTINYYSYDAPIEIELYCEKGIAKITGDTAHVKLNNGREYIASEEQDESLKYGENFKSYWGISHYKQINNYYDSLIKGIKPEITDEDALKTQEMICAIYNSGKTNKRIIF